MHDDQSVLTPPASGPPMDVDSPEQIDGSRRPRYPLFHPAIADFRKQYLSFYFIYATLLILLMWALLPIYWASLAYATQHTSRLTVWVVNRDRSTIGNGVVAAVQRAAADAASVPTLGWQVIDSDDDTVDSNDKVIDSVIDEQVWAAVVINQDATSDTFSVLSGGESSNLNGSAISVYYNEARNQFAADFYIVPFMNSLLVQTVAETNANITSHVLSSNADNATALGHLAKAMGAAGAGAQNGAVITYDLNNLRPFSAPVVSALTEVGMILIVIFSFILTMANSGLRPIIAPHLSLPHYILLRVFAPLIAYIPLSLSFAMISLPFHVPFHAKYTEAQGFFLFWIICYILMGGVGLATEFAIGVLTIRFAPFFLVTLIITNVSITEFPVELLPGVFRYGKGFPF